MAVKRKTYRFRGGDILDIEEYHDGDYGGRGKKRKAKTKPTKEEQKKVNQQNKIKRCRHKLLEYFNPGDLFVTLTYEVKNRPADMEEAKDHFKKMIRKVRNEYKKKSHELFWIRNIEKGTKGAWHTHLVLNEIGESAAIVKKHWTHGGIYVSEIKLNDKLYDEDFSKLAAYLTKDEATEELKQDGTPAKPRIKEANYSTSKNMPLPEPKEELLKTFREPKPKKGYYIVRKYEWINPVTGFKCRRYTQIRLKGGG